MAGGKIILFGLIALVILSGCAQQNDGKDVVVGDEVTGKKKFEKVSYKTEDGFEITGNLLRDGKKAVLLMHQFTLDKSSYDGFARKLNDANYTVLAIDLRGHGESLLQNGLKRGYADFSEQDFRDMILDAKGAKSFLIKEGYDLKIIVGASIGANTALNFASQDKDVEKAVLLSPGLNYKGIETEKNAPMVRAKVLVVASEGDDSYSFGSSKTLAGKMPNAEFKGMRNAGHGTRMFSGTNLENELVKWLEK